MKVKNLKRYIFRNWFGVSIVCILIIAAFLRFYDYENRFGLAYDQAHDAIVAKFALENWLIPLVGPFSSAGPFQTGGEWYAFLMAGFILIPFSALAPWIFMTLAYVLFVYLIIKVGENLVDKTFGLIAGIMASVSTAQIAQSTNLTNQGPLSIIGLVSIWAAIEWIRKKKEIYLFILGFFVSLGISIHMQAAALIVLIPLAIVFSGIKYLRPKLLFGLLISLFIPHIPLLLFDIQNDFVNLRGMIQYFLHDQYKISMDVLGRRWLTYAGVFWPAAWAHIIGAQIVFSYLIIVGIGLMFLYNLLTKNMNKIFLFLIISFSMMVIILRYIRTPLFDSYLVFLNPFVLLLSSYLIHFLYNKKRVVGIIVLLIIVGGSLLKDLVEITYRGNLVPRMMVVRWGAQLSQKYPDKQFSFFDYKLDSREISVPLVYHMYSMGKIDNNGLKIGITLLSDKETFPFELVAGDRDGYHLFFLPGSQSELEESGWFPINPSYIYNSTENWREISKK